MYALVFIYFENILYTYTNQNITEWRTNHFFNRIKLKKNEDQHLLLLALVLRQKVHSFRWIIRSLSESQYSKNLRAHALGCINFRTIRLIVRVSLRFKISSLFESSWLNFHSITFCASVLSLSAKIKREWILYLKNNV